MIRELDGAKSFGSATDWLSVTSPDKGNNKNNCDHIYRWGVPIDDADCKQRRTNRNGCKHI